MESGDVVVLIESAESEGQDLIVGVASSVSECDLMWPRPPQNVV